MNRNPRFIDQRHHATELISATVNRLVPVLVLFLLVAGCRTDEDNVTPSAPPGSDIWLFAMTPDGPELITRITDREGYDNQPMFMPGGRSILFTSDRSGRADIHLFEIESGLTTQISFTEADKYSPTPIPGTGGGQVSVVHTDSTTRQGLWRYSLDASIDPGPIATIDDVAYYTWVDNDRVLFWRLGDPSTLQLLNVVTSDTLVVAEDSAFSFKQIPSMNSSAYLASWTGKHSEIRRFDWSSSQSTVLAPALGDGRDFGVMPDGRVLMMNGSEMYSFDMNSGMQWELVGDLDISDGSRIAVGSDGSMIAVVGGR